MHYVQFAQINYPSVNYEQLNSHVGRSQINNCQGKDEATLKHKLRRLAYTKFISFKLELKV